MNPATMRNGETAARRRANDRAWVLLQHPVDGEVVAFVRRDRAAVQVRMPFDLEQDDWIECSVWVAADELRDAFEAVAETGSAVVDGVRGRVVLTRWGDAVVVALHTPGLVYEFPLPIASLPFQSTAVAERPPKKLAGAPGAGVA